MAAQEPLLEVRDLRLEYLVPGGRITALSGIDFAIDAGSALGLVGESGSGKSTAALAIIDLLPQEARWSAGTIRFGGLELSRLTARQRAELRGDRIGTVFQDPFTSLNPALPVGLQVAEPLIEHRGMTRATALARAIDLLDEVGIPRPQEVARSYPHQLSGGMQQRALIAAALSCEPALLVLDEPTTALDVTIEAQILELLRDLQERRRLGILFITHNLGVVTRLCDEVCVLYAGQIVENGPVGRVLARPAHPYTKGLIASLPELRARRRARLSAIPGRLPDLAHLPQGCIFHPRCPFGEARCCAPQAMIDLGDGVEARCWKADALLDQRWPGVDGQAGADAASRAPGTPIVRLDGLHKHFRGGGFLSSLLPGRGRSTVRAVDGVSLAVNRAETLGLVGESGSGKSTLGRCIVRLLDPTAGRITVAGTEVTDLRPSQLRGLRKQAQIIFQNPDSSLNPRKRVGRIVERPLELFTRLDGPERRARTGQLLDMVGLPPDYAERYPHQLSGGEKQRVGIARALATEPDFLVCDEPVSALDVSVQAAVLNLLADLRERFGLSYLFISHDLAVVAHLSDRIAVMYAGTIVEEGTTAQVLEPPYHPYTEALLSAVPLPNPRLRQRERVRLRAAAAGSPAWSGIGCPFQARCPRKLGTICEEVAPPDMPAAPGHRIACHIPLEELRRVPPAVPVPGTDEPAGYTGRTAAKEEDHRVEGA